MTYIQISNEEKEQIRGYTPEEYELFLLKKIEEYKNNSPNRKNKIMDNKFRFFVAPPYCGEEKYEETKEQRKKRLELKSHYKNLYSESLRTDTNDNLYYEKDDNYYDAAILMKSLNISRVTLDIITKDFESMRVGNKKYIKKSDMLDYLREHRYVGTNLDTQDMYKKVNNLKTKTVSEKENEENSNEILKIVNSEEYKLKWKRYFEEVPKEYRIFKNKNSIIEDGIEIFYDVEPNNYFDIYNPNIKISDKNLEKLPILNTLSYWSSLLGINDKTLTRYCHQGYLNHYKIGGRHMTTKEDIEMCQDLLVSRKKKKTNAGRKSRVAIFIEDNWDNLDFRDKIGSFNKLKYKKYYEIIDEIERFNKEEETKEIKITIEKLNSRKIRLRNQIINNVARKVTNKELETDIIKYYQVKEDFKNNKEKLDKAEAEKNKELEDQFIYIVLGYETDYMRRQELIIEEILKGIKEREN